MGANIGTGIGTLMQQMGYQQAPGGVGMGQLMIPKPLFMAPGPSVGLKFPGNIDLGKLTPTSNPDGSYSTVNSSSFLDENPQSPTYGKEVLVRGIIGGKRVEDIFGDDAKGRQLQLQALKAKYYQDGQHLGAFDNGDNADVYAQRLHQDWADGKILGVKMGTPKVK